MSGDLPDESSAVLSDVDDDEPPFSAPTPDHQTLISQLEESRRLNEELSQNLKRRDESINRLRAFAQEVIKKRDDAIREKEELLKQLKLANEEKDEISKQKDALKSETNVAAQMLATGIDKISRKIASYKSFSGGLPVSEKYATGLPSVAYGVIKRSNEIAEELLKQIVVTEKSRDQAREQVEQRNYEIAIEVSELEASISSLKDEVMKKGVEIERLESLVKDGNAKKLDLENEISKMREVGEDRDGKLRNLEEKMELMRPMVIDELRNISIVHEKVYEVLRILDEGLVDNSSDSSFVWEEMSLDENLQMLSKGILSVDEMAKNAVEKARAAIEMRDRKIDGLNDKINGLLEEKKYIGTLLRSALKSKTNEEVLQVAEDGLREAGIDLKFNDLEKEEDEVFSLAGALENTVKASQLEISELKRLVEALRAESSLLKAHLDAQSKEIVQHKLHIKELEEKERIANESVEGLMLEIASAEEEIGRWKGAAEQEAAAGRAVEQEFQSQLSTVSKELEETKKSMTELENKLKFKEETAAAAMAARDAADNSLRLADFRASKLRERIEELNRQIEELEKAGPVNSQNNHRYICWPWQWLGLNIVRQPSSVQENSNEMELSEPLV